MLVHLIAAVAASGHLQQHVDVAATAAATATAIAAAASVSC